MPEFPRTVVLDSGAGADADPIGGSWTTLGATYVGTALRRVSNTIRANALTDSGAYWNATTYAEAQEAYVTIAQASVSQSSGDFALGLVLRGTGLTGTATSYVAYLRNAGEPLHDLEIWKIVASGGPGEIYGPAEQFSFDTGDQFGFRAIGSALTVYKNGAVIAATTDSSSPITGTGNIGLIVDEADWQMTNFGGGSYVTPAPDVNWSLHPKYKLRRV